MEMRSKRSDEKFCSECAAVIKAKAVVCPKCGCPQSGGSTLPGSAATGQGKNKNTAGILALLLGGLGAHKFYLARPMAGALYLIFCFTFIPAILGLFEAVKLFGMSTQAFDAQYNRESV